MTGKNLLLIDRDKTQTQSNNINNIIITIEHIVNRHEMLVLEHKDIKFLLLQYTYKILRILFYCGEDVNQG